MKKNFNIESLNISIIGLGLVGGSYAKALKALKPKNIWAVDIDESSLIKGENMGIIDKGYSQAEEPLKNSDIVIICLYPNLVGKFVVDNMDNFKDGAIITDVTGIKAGLVESINKIIPDNMDFVFGHPMAGREKKGLEYSSAEVFKGANYIITPTEKNRTENIDLIEWIARNIGFKKVVRISPEKHDEIVAFTSQLPHVIAVALINSDNLNIHTGSYVGDSYRELTRIAEINENLWSELFIGNKENLIEKIEVFEKKLKILKEGIRNGENKVLEKEFLESSKRRREL